MHGWSAKDESTSMATPPRRVVPGRTLHLTIRAVNRQYRFVPTDEITASIKYIVCYCINRYGMSLHDMVWMSNHAHINLTDVHGRLPDFVQHMNSLISLQLNRLAGRSGPNFQEGYRDIQLLDNDAALIFLKYTLANPCTANLVEKASDWGGVTTYNDEYGQSIVAKRPDCGLWAPLEIDENDEKAGKPKKIKKRVYGGMPGECLTKLVRPQIRPDLDDEELRTLIREQTTQSERDACTIRRVSHKKVVGMNNVRQLKWNDFPPTPEEQNDLIPLVAATCEELKKRALTVIRAFRTAYRHAFDNFVKLGKAQVVFPNGTWKMRTVFEAHSNGPWPELVQEGLGFPRDDNDPPPPPELSARAASPGDAGFTSSDPLLV